MRTNNSAPGVDKSTMVEVERYEAAIQLTGPVPKHGAAPPRPTLIHVGL
jgi:hypothetical protein